MKREYLPLFAIALLFAALFVWSVIYETLLPLLRAGDIRGIVAHIVGIPIIVAGTAVFVYGGFRLLRGVFTLMQDKSFKEHALVIKKQPSPKAVREARKAHLQMWGAALRGGILWMAIGFAGIALGGWIINF